MDGNGNTITKRDNKKVKMRLLKSCFDEKKYARTLRKEGYDVGFKQGQIETLTKLVRAGRMTLQEAAAETGVSVEEFENEKDESLF